ncbi:hypothetical protein ABGB12_01500 [Actinocorallia sp. B10E7]|uniref:hypothetical protein n=1 Tax=Actinocorallia sp. B10E7 TaxID=3153558 RepID=UPI00325CAC66
MRRLGLTTLVLLALTGCSDPSPARNPESAAGPIRTIERAPIPSRISHTAVWTDKEMVVWGGDACPPTAQCVALNTVEDGVALNPAKD